MEHEPVDPPSPTEQLSIGAFARRSRLSIKALRLYDRLGLVRPVRVDPHNGYRWYLESQLETARLVGLLRRLDMPLARIGEVIVAPAPAAAEQLVTYWAEVERRVTGQRELVDYLAGKLTGRTTSDCVVRQRDVPEQWVLTEQRHVQVDELSCWIGAALRRLCTAAVDQGGSTGHPFVVYYGTIDADSDGPAEVCVPIDPGRADRTDVAIRREPAHREAYTPLRRVQVEFPQILGAYDQVARWIDEHGLTPGGAPREVYFGEFMSAEPDDEVCELAFPLD
ncbi:MerR family transcriptional regulator [Actinokineospora enzanensis]|uniref:MerR family transcriptional regulator n=1 Tax=Actinokineospora enzanensis TaxID=155975 RepID=UPI00037544B3|nr:MerR family transcriptional regulator [Actinokineospora enzanensis]